MPSFTRTSCEQSFNLLIDKLIAVFNLAYSAIRTMYSTLQIRLFSVLGPILNIMLTVALYKEDISSVRELLRNNLVQNSVYSLRTAGKAIINERIGKVSLRNPVIILLIVYAWNNPENMNVLSDDVSDIIESISLRVEWLNIKTISGFDNFRSLVNTTYYCSLSYIQRKGSLPDKIVAMVPQMLLPTQWVFNVKRRVVFNFIYYLQESKLTKNIKL